MSFNTTSGRELADIMANESSQPATPASVEQANEGGSAATTTPPTPKRRRRTNKRPKRRQLPPFNVVLLDDNDHTYDYVIEMLRSVFGYDLTRGFQMAECVDRTGRVIVFTSHKELAELKRDQIAAFGLDKRISTCRGSMQAVLEPAK